MKPPRNAHTYEPKDTALARLREIINRLDRGIEPDARITFSCTVGWYVPDRAAACSITWSNKGKR